MLLSCSLSTAAVFPCSSPCCSASSVALSECLLPLWFTSCVDKLFSSLLQLWQLVWGVLVIHSVSCRSEVATFLLGRCMLLHPLESLSFAAASFKRGSMYSTIKALEECGGAAAGREPAISLIVCVRVRCDIHYTTGPAPIFSHIPMQGIHI